MTRSRPLIVLLVVLAAVVRTGPVAADDPNEPPLVGQPQHAPFSEAVGSNFNVSMHADPVKVQVGDPISLRIEITAKATWKRPPTRPDLRRLPEFKKNFRIENQPVRDRSDTKSGVWEFHYLLKPVSDRVSRVPAVPLLYFKPGVVPKEKGYRTVYADSIPLTVSARPEVQANDVKDAADTTQAQDLSSWNRRPFGLHSQPGVALPGALLLVLVLLVPPAICAAWYALWRCWNPDAARLAEIKKNRAARRALQALAKLDGGDGDEQARRVSALLASYLRERFDFPAEEPTPEELAHFFDTLGFSSELSDEARDYFRASDAARFAPARDGASRDALAAAQRLILALEASPCTPHTS